MRKVCTLCQEKAVLTAYPCQGSCYVHHGTVEGWFRCSSGWEKPTSLCQKCFEETFPPETFTGGGTSISECPECRKVHGTATTVHSGKRVLFTSEYGSKYDTCSFKFCRKEHQARYMKQWLKMSHREGTLDNTLCLCDSCITSFLRKGIITWG